MNPPSAQNSPTIGVVIPAYNEMGSLRSIVAVACAIDWLKQIVIVNDGSTDGTLATAQLCAIRDDRVQVVHLPVNRGKAGAMLAGVQTLQTDIVIFLDADLVNVQPYQIQRLLDPVLTGACDMTLALFRHGRWRTDLSHRLTPSLSGQRCLWRAAAAEALVPIAQARYGVEIALTKYAHSHGWRIRQVIWSGVTHRMKEEKRKGMLGVYTRWQMYHDIAAVLMTKKEKAPALMPSASSGWPTPATKFLRARQ